MITTNLIWFNLVPTQGEGDSNINTPPNWNHRSPKLTCWNNRAVPTLISQIEAEMNLYQLNGRQRYSSPSHELYEPSYVSGAI